MDQLENRKHVAIFILLQIALIATSFYGGFLFHKRFGYPAGEFPLLKQAYTILKENALDELPEENLLEHGMIRGMLQAYGDPHTVLIEPVQHELQVHQFEGKFGGIGARVELDLRNQVFLFPFPGSPAEKAGIRDGDRLIAVDDLQITPETGIDEILAAIRGPIGRTVTLQIRRSPRQDDLTVRVRREEITLPSVTANLAPQDERVGVIHVNLIATTTAAEIEREIDDLQQRGATHFVIDLRDNAGGLVEAGVDIARLFLEKGVIISQKYRGETVKTFNVASPGKYTDLPLALLVNSGTASAAEIVAGALKQHQRAVLIGSHTYGKDTIQLVFDLQDQSSIHVTAARWWIPGFDPPLGETGLIPDISLSDENTRTPLIMETAVGYLLN